MVKKTHLDSSLKQISELSNVLPRVSKHPPINLAYKILNLNDSLSNWTSCTGLPQLAYTLTWEKVVAAAINEKHQVFTTYRNTQFGSNVKRHGGEKKGGEEQNFTVLRQENVLSS